MKWEITITATQGPWFETYPYGVTSFTKYWEERLSERGRVVATLIAPGYYRHVEGPGWTDEEKP